MSATHRGEIDWLTLDRFMPPKKIDAASIEAVIQSAVLEICSVEEGGRWQEVQLDQDTKFPVCSCSHFMIRL